MALNQWYKVEFEKLGWMVLAKSYGMHDKVNMYKKSLKRLHDHIACKIDLMRDEDRRDDLIIMLKNTKVLLDHAHKDF
jgi:hypothetical protein